MSPAEETAQHVSEAISWAMWPESGSKNMAARDEVGSRASGAREGWGSDPEEYKAGRRGVRWSDLCVEHHLRSGDPWGLRGCPGGEK